MADDSIKETFWRDFFLNLSDEEKLLVRHFPNILRCEKEDYQVVGEIAYLILSHQTETAKWRFTLRTTGSIVASLFNKRFGLNLDYMDFYLSEFSMNRGGRRKQIRILNKKYGWFIPLESL